MRKTLLVSLISLFILGGCASGSEVSMDELPGGSFFLAPSGMFYGEWYVKGYPVLQTVPEPFCEGDDCPTHRAVFFVILESGNTAFSNFLSKNLGQNPSQPPYVNLGCVEDNLLSYSNDSDAYGMREFHLGAEESRAIASANQEEPVILRLSKLQLSGGRGAPACYSHFTYVSLYHPKDVSLVKDLFREEVAEPELSVIWQTPRYLVGRVVNREGETGWELFYAARVGEERWTIVHDGGGAMSCALKRDFGFPDHVFEPQLLPNCQETSGSSSGDQL